jgi:hypothetical protein
LRLPDASGFERRCLIQVVLLYSFELARRPDMGDSDFGVFVR